MIPPCKQGNFGLVNSAQHERSCEQGGWPGIKVRVEEVGWKTWARVGGGGRRPWAGAGEAEMGEHRTLQCRTKRLIKRLKGLQVNVNKRPKMPGKTENYMAETFPICSPHLVFCLQYEPHSQSEKKPESLAESGQKGTWKWEVYWGDYLAPDGVFYWGGGAAQQVWQNIWLWTRTAARPKGISVRGKSLKRPIASTRLLTWWEVQGVDRRWQVLLLSFVTCFPPLLFQPVDFYYPL